MMARTKENITKIQEEMRKREEGPTLKEKIDESLERVKEKQVIEHLNDCFFKEETENGFLF